MNILEISVRSDIGGGPKHLLDLSVVNSASVDIFIAAPSNGEYASSLKQIATEFIDIPFRKFSIITFFKLLRICKKNQIKVVHSHGRGAGFYSRLLKLFGLRVIHTFHGIHIEKSIAGRVKLLLDKVLVPLTDKFICVSDSEKINAIKHNVTTPSKTHVIHNGVIIPESVSIPDNTEFVIGTLSRLNYQKGLDILLDFISQFESKNDVNFKCLIAGSGELEGELKAKNTCKSVEFLGSVDGQDFLKGIDLYISFARWEGLPLAVIEAMSHTKPCLISNVEGNTDLITNGEDGYLFNLDSYSEFEKKLLELINNKELQSKLGQNAREKVIQSFSVDQMAKKTLSVYEELNKE